MSDDLKVSVFHRCLLFRFQRISGIEALQAEIDDLRQDLAKMNAGEESDDDERDRDDKDKK